MQWLMQPNLFPSIKKMQTLKELIQKIYKDLKQTDRIIHYPELSEIETLSDYIQDLALDMMPKFVNRDNLKNFVDECEKNYKESTFKKFIPNYSSFLDSVESEFYNSLLFSLTE